MIVCKMPAPVINGGTLVTDVTNEKVILFGTGLKYQLFLAYTLCKLLQILLLYYRSNMCTLLQQKCYVIQKAKALLGSQLSCNHAIKHFVSSKALLCSDISAYFDNLCSPVIMQAFSLLISSSPTVHMGTSPPLIILVSFSLLSPHARTTEEIEYCRIY